MVNLLLGVTGSVAAIKTPELYHELVQAGFRVRVVPTHSSLYFFDVHELQKGAKISEGSEKVIFGDEDEWPGRKEGRRYVRQDPVTHIELRRWADAMLIAPLDANTLAKMANGLCDNCLTCVIRAWDYSLPLVLAPAMNTLMWESRFTLCHFEKFLQSLGFARELPDEMSTALSWINSHLAKIRIIPPAEKKLACGDIGMGAMAEISEICRTMREMVSK